MSKLVLMGFKQVLLLKNKKELRHSMQVLQKRYNHIYPFFEKFDHISSYIFIQLFLNLSSMFFNFGMGLDSQTDMTQRLKCVNKGFFF